MGRFTLSFKVWWQVLRDPSFADRVRPLLVAPAIVAAPEAAAQKTAAPRPRAEATQSDALTVLSVLQREARLIDFLKENIAPYSNEQIGAAVRDIHRDAGGALDRLFALKPVMAEPEGAPVHVPKGFNAARIRLVGNVSGEPPFHGTLRHAGWEATHVQLPQWSGTEASANVIAPAEVELP